MSAAEINAIAALVVAITGLVTAVLAHVRINGQRAAQGPSGTARRQPGQGPATGSGTPASRSANGR